MVNKEKLNLEFVWNWCPKNIKCSISNISGESIPEGLRGKIRNISITQDKNSDLWELGKNLDNFLHDKIPKPNDLDSGFEKPLEGSVGETSIITKKGDKILILFFVNYDGEQQQRGEAWFEIKDLPEVIKNIIKDLDFRSKQKLQSHFFSIYGKGKVDNNKWKKLKKKVFISYRGDKKDLALDLHTKLGEYGDSSFFIPQMDRVDMKAGDWVDQLQKMISECDVFIPILTKDYLEGPIAKPELNMALRQSWVKKNTEIIPILIEGSFDDYTDTFLGSHNAIDALGGIDDEVIDQVGYLALGVSKNKFEE